MERSVVSIRKKWRSLLKHPCRSPILSFAKGQTIYSPLDPATNIFLVISGKVKVGWVTAGGREIVMNVYKTDDIFGESALIESSRSSSASTLENTKVVAWTVAQFESISLQSPKLLYALLHMMTGRLEQFEERIESFTVDDNSRRLARALLEFSKNTVANTPDGPARMESLTHELLSLYIGTSRAVVTQSMNRFRRLGYLSYSRKGVVLFPHRLQRLLLDHKDDTSTPTSLPTTGFASPRAHGELDFAEHH